MSSANPKVRLIKKLLSSGMQQLIIPSLEKMTPSDLALVFSDLNETEAKRLAHFIVQSSKTGHILSELPDHVLVDFFCFFNLEEFALFVIDLPPDLAASLLKKLPHEKRLGLLEKIPNDKTEIIEKLLLYPEHSAGYVMTQDYFAIESSDTTQKAIAEFKERSQKKPVIYIYVTEGKRLVGVLPLRSLLLSSPETSIKDLMKTDVVSVFAFDDQEIAAKLVSKNHFLAIPVVNNNHDLLGVISFDDIVDIVEKETTEDVQKFGGMEALEEPYMQVSIRRMIRKRASWLVILFLSEMFTATAMAFFEGAIQKAVVLALFVPLIISSGGNSGSQASTLVIRALALGEIGLRDWWRVMRREIYSGLLLGFILGGIGFARIAIWSSFSNLYGPHWILIAFTVSFALIGIVLWGTFVGSMLPFILSRFGFDPASSSAPFVATLVDVTGLIIYFTVASLLLSGTML